MRNVLLVSRLICSVFALWIRSCWFQGNLVLVQALAPSDLVPAARHFQRWGRSTRMTTYHPTASPRISLDMVPSKQSSSVSVPITNATDPKDTSTTPSDPVGSAESSPMSTQERLEDMRERHKLGEQLTQDYCDGMLAYCVAHDEWDSVLDVLDIMNLHNLSQVRSTYRACLAACRDARNAASAREILTAMQQAGVKPEPHDVAICVATMCAKEQAGEKGWWRKALTLVQENSKDLPTVAYDSVLSCMASEKSWKEAVRLLRRMEQSGSVAEPTLSTYRYVIECCVHSDQAEQAVQVLQACIKRGYKPPVYLFELVIGALSRKLQWRRAMQLLDLMDDLKLPRTLVAYNTVISACAKAREVVQAKNLLVQMRKNGIQPDVVSFNSVMAACASTSRWKDALSVLDQCHREPGVSPDIYTYTNAIRACAKGGKTRRSLSLLQVVKDKGLPIDTYCYTAAIEACAKAKMWKKALELLDEMEEKGIAPSEVTYSVTITACGNGGQWQKALNLLDVMREKGMSINVITYNAAITALSKAAKHSAKAQVHADGGQLWTRVMGLLEQMQFDGIEPDGFSFSSAISCCGAEGRWEEALQLMEVMQKGGPRTRPNRIAYTAAIASCGRSGQVDHALRLFGQMKEQGLSADRVAYNALFSALRVAKKADKAYELWCEMCGMRPVNTTGRKATAKSDASTTPDIITVTEALAAMSAPSSDRLNCERADKVFAEAVKRGIVLRKDTLDSYNEFDLSGMSFPVARAACRFTVNRVVDEMKDGKGADDLTFITGVGVAKGHRRSNGNVGDDRSTSLREYVQEVLSSDFDPPIVSTVPDRAQGTVQIRKETLREWPQQMSS